MLEKGCTYDRDNVDVSIFYQHGAFKAHKAAKQESNEKTRAMPDGFVLHIDKDGWATMEDYMGNEHEFFIPDHMLTRFSRHSAVDFEDDVKSISFFIVLREERLELDKVIISLRDIEI